jgi:hypothetical protein
LENIDIDINIRPAIRRSATTNPPFNALAVEAASANHQ